MERVGSPLPPRTWEEAHELLERVVEEAAKRNLFDSNRTSEEAASSILALLKVDDELALIAARLHAGPAEFLDILLPSPEDQRRRLRVQQLVGEEVVPGASIEVKETALLQVLAAHPELLPERGLQYEHRLLLVQEAIREWGVGGEEPPSGRKRYLLAIAELIVGCGAWVFGLSGVALEPTLALLVGIVMIADATYRWHMHFLSRRGEGPETYVPIAVLLFRGALLIAVLLYSMALGAWSFDIAYRAWDAVLGTIALVVGVRLLRSGQRAPLRR